MKAYKKAFDTLIGVKSEANQHEIELIKRGQKYISKLAKIPGVEMIAIVNSLSMYATHQGSDIDLLVITRPGMIWFVRFWSTLILWIHGVWRRDQDIAGNLCLSFFVTTEALDLSRIAIEDDIYLYYWIYYMRPIVDKNKTYEQFLRANKWVNVDEEREERNKKYLLSHSFKFASSFGEFYQLINNLIRHFLLSRTQRSYKQLGRPEGVIISDQMLKFHDRDRRREIRDQLI